MNTKKVLLGTAAIVSFAGLFAYAADGTFDNLTANLNTRVTGKLAVGVAPSIYKFEVREANGVLNTSKFKATNQNVLLDVDSSGVNNGARFQFRNNNAGTWRMGNVNSDNSMRFFDDVTNIDVLTLKQGGNIGIGTANPTEKLEVVGDIKVSNDVSCAVLEIRGQGNDLAETFKVSGAPEPGMVVSIDPAQAGELTLASAAYDRKVAGIISGAGDRHAGIHLGDAPSKEEGEQAVALTGRVWCWVDASHCSITPGDSLTTSGTPGHAMKVTDHALAQGATLGKAMTGLESGKGLVLVLVNLH